MLIVVFSPFILLISFVLILFSKANPIYYQYRVGRNGEHFRLYKFRTMNSNPDILTNYFNKSPDQKKYFKENQKLLHDPRITKIGFFLREFSIDELPQLFNILKGDMSFIGPRPIVKAEISKYGKYFEKYIEVKPGLSGLWQVSGRNDTTYDQRIKHDIFYIENQSLLLDIKIFFKTFLVVFSRKGAY